MATQCSNRLDTIKKHRTERRQHNALSGADPVSIPYDEEFQKIKFIDDSVEPELFREPGRVEFTSSATSRSSDGTKPDIAKDTLPTKKQKVNSVCKMMQKIHMHKEQRECRYKEKLEVLHTFLAPEKDPDV